MSRERPRIALLNVLITVENVLGVYRNFCSLSKRSKCLAVLQIACITSIYTAFASFLCHAMYIFSQLQIDSQMSLAYTAVFTFFTTLITVVNFYVSVQRSANFKLAVEKIDAVHEFCKTHSLYSRSFRKINIRVLVNFALLSASNLVIFFVLAVPESSRQLSATAYAMYALNAIVLVLRDTQFYVELIMFNLLINIVKFGLRQIRILLTSSLGRSDSNHDHEGSVKIDCDQLLNEVEMTVPVYSSMAVCSDKLKQCFGIQVVFSLLNLTLFYIFLSYLSVTSLMKMGKIFQERMSHLVLTVIQLLNFMITIVAMLKAGQQAHNEMDKLLRSIVRLHNFLFTIPATRAKRLQESVKNFHRQMKTDPVRIKILSQTPVQMTLLLQILSTIVCYTIISLQLNHVV